MKHIPRKRFGQNFLHDPGVIQHILQVIDAQPDEHIVEIGPGQGAITEGLLATAGKLDVIELDRDLIAMLEKKYGSHEKMTVYNADALKFDFAQLVQNQELLRVVGNLPYNISTPLLFHLLDQAHVIRDMFFMLQKEVVDRLAALPGSHAYGRLSIMVQLYCEVEKQFNVGPGAFSPAPRVDSAVVRIIPRNQASVTVNNKRQLQTLVTQAFSKRRKTLRNALKGLLDDTQISSLDIDPRARPETLTPEQFAALANLLETNKYD